MSEKNKNIEITADDELIYKVVHGTDLSDADHTLLFERLKDDDFNKNLDLEFKITEGLTAIISEKKTKPSFSKTIWWTIGVILVAIILFYLLFKPAPAEKPSIPPSIKTETIVSPVANLDALINKHDKKIDFIAVQGRGIGAVNSQPNISKNDSDLMKLIKTDYDSGKHEAVIKSINKVEDENLRNKILIYKGICFYKLKKLPEAKNLFLDLKKSSNSVKYNASWYLAMIYLKQKKINEATIELKLIKDNPSGVMSEEATALLNDLSPSK